ncbi:hypothetical protein M4J39_04395 [Pleomorphomonas sp. NRKKF1]|nr:hypothetical protein [Pleomorphomonas sp. NRK KF1]
MSKYLSNGTISLFLALLFYGMVVIIANTNGQLCDQTETILSCIREWVIAFSGVFGAVSVFIVSFVALSLEKKRDDQLERLNGRAYALAAIDVVNHANSIAFKYSLSKYPSSTSRITAEFLDEIADSCRNLIDQIIAVEKTNTFDLSADYPNQLINATNKFSNAVLLARLFTPFPETGEGVAPDEMQYDQTDEFFLFSQATENYANKVEDIAKKYGTVFLSSKHPSNIEINTDDAT